MNKTVCPQCVCKSLKYYRWKVMMDCDLHDIIDVFVIFEIISPCSQKSLMTACHGMRLIQPCTGTRRFFHKSNRKTDKILLIIILHMVLLCLIEFGRISV